MVSTTRIGSVPPGHQQIRQTHQEVERYKVIGQASRQVYEKLDKACTKHTEHQADFCVQFNQAIINEDHGVQVKFDMAYTHLTLTSSADQCDLIWFVVNSANGDFIKAGCSSATTDFQDAVMHSLKRQIEPNSGATQKKVEKSVRFQSTAQT